MKEFKQCIWCAVAVTSVFLIAINKTHACTLVAKQDLDDIQYADVVVVGRVTNYKIVRDEEFRSGYLRLARKMLAQPELMPQERKRYEQMLERYGGTKSFLRDYARFDVDVEEVLVGKAEDVISVTWDNSTFGEPKDMPAGPFLIALRKPGSKRPPLRGPSATILPNRDPHTLTVLQAPCASAFMFKITDDRARRLREILNAK